MRFTYFQPANITGQATYTVAKFNGLIYNDVNLEL